MRIRPSVLLRTAVSRLALAGLALLAPTQVAHASVIFMGHEYEVVLASGVTWDAARTAATALGPGWDLATIGTAAENTFVESQLNPALGDRSHFWIGATDQVIEGLFQWVDGTPFAFTDWHGSEPNNLGNEDFLAYDLRFGTWAWNDASQTDAFALNLIRGFVAEREVPLVDGPEPATLFLVGIGAVAAGLRRRRG